MAGLRYEEIAELAGVNRNSVHRNRPDRAELVKDALLQYAEDSAPLHDSGDLRPDLVDFLVALAERPSSSVGRAMQATVTATANTDLAEAMRAADDSSSPPPASGSRVPSTGEKFRLSTATSSPSCCPGRK